MLRVAAFLISVCLLSSFAWAQDNFLVNPSFEQPNAAGDGPAGWAWGRVYGSGPLHFEWTREAHSGQRAFRMISLHATQLLYQDLVLPAGTRYTCRIFAKGSGKLRFSLQPRKGNELVAAATEADWTLTDRWLDYWADGVVPEGCERVRLHIITPTPGCDVLLDDAQVILGDWQPPTPPTLPPEPRAGACLTARCRLQCTPYAGTDLPGLCDGDVLEGGLQPEQHPGRGARFAFILPAPAVITQIELAQAEHRPATSYLIDADTDGDGGFDATLVRVTGTGQSGAVIGHRFPPLRVYAVRFCGLQGEDRYGRVYPTLTEFRIRGEEPEPLSVPQPGPAPARSATLRPVGVPRSLPQPTRDLAVPMAARTARGVFVEPWMFGMGKDSPPPFESLGAVDQFLWQLDYLGADHVWLFPSAGGSRSPIWPSRIVEGTEWDALTPMVRTLAQRDIRTFVIFGQLPKLLDESMSYPRWLGGLLAEVAASGAHGASICADEYPQCGGPPDPETYAAALQTELGLQERPAHREDTEAFRRWQLFHYRQVAAAHRQAAQHALAVNPDFLFTSNWRVDPVALNTTYGTLAYDILAQTSGLHFMGTDPYYDEAARRTYMERTVKLLAAAARPRGCLPVLKGGSWDFAHLERYRGILLNGSAVAAVMHGAAGVSFYRMNYLFLNNKAHLVREAFAMIEWLDSIGLRDTHLPPAIAVLHSRASEDFWQLRQEMTIGADLKVDGIRGYVAHKLIEEELLRRSLPFEVHYLEREDDLAELERYAVIVLPFAYCISDAAVAAIDRAVRAGSKLLICERLGEADELGNLRPAPALADWTARDGVRFLGDVVDRFTDPQFRSHLGDTLDTMLAGRCPIKVASAAGNVEAIVREGNGHWLLACINWEPEDALLAVHLRLPPGDYAVTQCDGYGVRAAGIAERTGQPEQEGQFLWGAVPAGGAVTVRQALSDKDLADFTVHLERDQVRIYDIRRR